MFYREATKAWDYDRTAPFALDNLESKIDSDGLGQDFEVMNLEVSTDLYMPVLRASVLQQVPVDTYVLIADPLLEGE